MWATSTPVRGQTCPIQEQVVAERVRNDESELVLADRIVDTVSAAVVAVVVAAVAVEVGNVAAFVVGTGPEVGPGAGSGRAASSWESIGAVAGCRSWTKQHRDVRLMSRWLRYGEARGDAA